MKRLVDCERGVEDKEDDVQLVRKSRAERQHRVKPRQRRKCSRDQYRAPTDTHAERKHKPQHVELAGGFGGGGGGEATPDFDREEALGCFEEPAPDCGVNTGRTFPTPPAGSV